ncbi:hypothetical protein TNCV_2247661 [Trichonephila clavipes]|nr:hypothetical protein TNCV_2247661 [Trichonephila clavipes]
MLIPKMIQKILINFRAHSLNPLGGAFSCPKKSLIGKSSGSAHGIPHLLSNSIGYLRKYARETEINITVSRSPFEGFINRPVTLTMRIHSRRVGSGGLELACPLRKPSMRVQKIVGRHVI